MSVRRSMIAVFAVLALAGCVQEPPDALLPATTVAGAGTTDEGPAAAAVAFRPAIQADLDTLGCSGAACHGGGALPMPLTGHPEADAQWEANYQQVRARAGSSSSQSPLLAKAAGDGGHIAALEPDHPAVLRWKAWITSGTPYDLDGGSAGGGGGDPGEGGSGGGSAGPTWDDDIGPLLAARGCLDCHGTSNAQGAYSVATYAAAKGFGSDDVANIVPGDAGSLLVEYAEDGHGALAAPDALTILGWVVDHDAVEH